jgi:hypothetical protein
MVDLSTGTMTVAMFTGVAPAPPSLTSNVLLSTLLQCDLASIFASSAVMGGFVLDATCP